MATWHASYSSPCQARLYPKLLPRCPKAIAQSPGHCTHFTAAHQQAPAAVHAAGLGSPRGGLYLHTHQVQRRD